MLVLELDCCTTPSTRTSRSHGNIIRKCLTTLSECLSCWFYRRNSAESYGTDLKIISKIDKNVGNLGIRVTRRLCLISILSKFLSRPQFSPPSHKEGMRHLHLMKTFFRFIFRSSFHFVKAHLRSAINIGRRIYLKSCWEPCLWSVLRGDQSVSVKLMNIFLFKYCEIERWLKIRRISYNWNYMNSLHWPCKKPSLDGKLNTGLNAPIL